MNINEAIEIANDIRNGCRNVGEADAIITLAKAVEDLLAFNQNIELQRILRKPNFWCSHIAESLRQCGHDIDNDSGVEQGYVIGWLQSLYLLFGANWRDEYAKQLGGIK